MQGDIPNVITTPNFMLIGSGVLEFWTSDTSKSGIVYRLSWLLLQLHNYVTTAMLHSDVYIHVAVWQGSQTLVWKTFFVKEKRLEL